MFTLYLSRSVKSHQKSLLEEMKPTLELFFQKQICHVTGTHWTYNPSEWEII